MPSPFSSHGAILVERADLLQAIVAVEGLLQRSKPSSLVTTGTRIDFSATFLRSLFASTLLVPIGSGSVIFQQTDRGLEVRYRISFVRLLVEVTVGVILLFGVLPVLSDGHFHVSLPVLGLMWLWLFGGSYLIAIFRFPAALRSALGEVFDAVPVATHRA